MFEEGKEENKHQPRRPNSYKSNGCSPHIWLEQKEGSYGTRVTFMCIKCFIPKVEVQLGDCYQSVGYT
jgi:hypothetical protein